MTGSSAATEPVPLRSSAIARALRTLYLARFVFALIWAALLVLVGPASEALTVALLVLYPTVDLVAAVIDHRASRSTRSARVLYLNMALSLLAAVGLAIAAPQGAGPALLVWGAWAITAGLVQLVVGIGRRALGGQWPMILSGGISVLAGAGFLAQGSNGAGSVTALAGYATLGGVFFLISALRLQRTARGDA